MRIVLEAKIERADGTRQTVEIFALDRAPDSTPSCGIGLLLSESRELVGNLQGVVLREQAAEVIAAARRCRHCSLPLAVKGNSSIVYRTAFGKIRLDAPRLYSRCSCCGTRVAEASSSVRANVQRVGSRLEAEMQRRAEDFWAEHHDDQAVDAGAAVHALQIDAGYVRSVPQTEGTSWISVIASKVVRPQTRRTHAHAYTTRSGLQHGPRQEAFLESVGIGGDVPVTVLCDGGEDAAVASRLGNRSMRILDWFHIGMRFQHLLLGLKGLQGIDDDERERLHRSAEGAKWFLWHGKAQRCLERLGELRRDTGWVGKRNALGKLVAYLEGNTRWLTNYADRWRRGLPISSAGAESAVDHVIGQRMKTNGHARWSRRGANHLLQVRCAVLNGQDVRNFKRWYPTQRPTPRAA